MIVVSNTSPIVNLAAVDQLHLLKQIYGRLLIPRAVYREIAVVGSGLPGAAEVESEEWIETRAVKDNSLVAALSAELDAGGGGGDRSGRRRERRSTASGRTRGQKSGQASGIALSGDIGRID